MRLLMVLGLAVVVVCGLVVAEVLVRAQVESSIEERLSGAVDTEVEVTTSGPLAGLAVLTGRIGVLDVVARDVPLPDSPAVIDVLSARIVNLQLDGREPVAGSGTFQAWLTEDQVRRSLPAEVSPLLTLGPDALVVDLGFTRLPLRVVVAGTSLRLEPVDDLPPLIEDLISQLTAVRLTVPNGVMLTSAAVIDGRLRLSGTIDPVVVAGR